MRWTRMLFIPAVAVFALGPVPSIPTYAGTAACTIVGTNGHDVLHGTSSWVAPVVTSCPTVEATTS